MLYDRFLALKGLGGLDEAAPVLEHLGRMPVNLQPRQRLAKRTAVHQRLARARREVHVGQTALQAEDLTEPFDIPTSEWEQAE